MNSPSIERLYAKLNKHILLAQSYTEIKELAFIIKACRLKPFSYIFEKRDSKVSLHSWWFDEFGNSLKIIKKKLKITYNDLAIDRDKIICTDLYYGFSLNNFVKFSKLLFLMVGKDEDNENCIFISFLGIDNYLRTFIYINNEWKQISSLILGINNLKNIFKNLDMKYFSEISINKNNILPCATGRQWISFMPTSKIFLQLMKKEHDDTFSFLNSNNKELNV